MAKLDYPQQLTKTHWDKNKGLLAKSKPTGIGEALVKLAKAHEDLDLALFDTAKLGTADAVAKVLETYEKEAKKHFVKAFQEAKTVEDVATTGAAALKKAALAPKSAVEAATAVAKAASDYAVELTSVRQTGVSGLEKLLESLRKSEAKKQDEGGDEDDENAPAHVIAAKVARKVVAAFKIVKSSQGETDRPPMQFLIGAGKTACSVFVGVTAGASQKSLLKKILADEDGPFKYYAGECVWERNAYTFVGEDIPLGGFVKRVQKSLEEATSAKVKVRVRRSSGEAEDADDGEEPFIPEAPPLPTTSTTSTTSPGTTGSTPPGDTAGGALVKQRLKLLMPKLQVMLAWTDDKGVAVRRVRDELTLKISGGDFEAAALILDKLDSLAAKNGVTGQTATPQQVDPRDERIKELVLAKIETSLANADRDAKAIAATPAYKTALLRQHGLLLAEKERLSQQSATAVARKALPNLLRRCQLLETRAAAAAVDGPDAQSKLNDWAKKRLVTLETSLRPPAHSDGLRDAIAPSVETIRKKIAEGQRLIDNGEFKKGVDLATAVYHLITSANTAIANHARDYPAYKVERDKAVTAIANLKRHAQAPALAAEIRAIEKQLADIDSVALADDGWVKAKKAVALIAKQCATVHELAEKLVTNAGKLPGLKLKFTEGGSDPTTADKLAGFAHKLIVEESCTEEEAVQMARDVDAYMGEGLDERDALVSARVSKSLKDARIPAEKAKIVGKVMRAGGTSNAQDAKAVALGMARLSVGVLENLIGNGIPTECFRGGVTEIAHDCVGVVPRGWESTGKTWDHVPGMFSPDLGKVLVGTMDKDGKRKVPGKFEVAGDIDGVEISHGTDDLVGHEAGHAFDVSDGDVKNKNADFRAARLRDIAAGNLIKRAVPVPPVTTPPTAKGQPADGAKGMFVTRDDYFVVQAEAGVDETNANSGSQGDLDAACSETFAESFAMHFAGNSRWPELDKFWQTNPWGV